MTEHAPAISILAGKAERLQAGSICTAAGQDALRPRFLYAEREAAQRELGVLIETLIIAAVVSLGVIVAGKAIITARAISRRPSYPLARLIHHPRHRQLGW
jgi:hypothetical protein